MVVILLPYVFRPQILLSYVLHIVGTVNFALLFFSKILPQTDWEPKNSKKGYIETSRNGLSRWLPPRWFLTPPTIQLKIQARESQTGSLIWGYFWCFSIHLWPNGGWIMARGESRVVCGGCKEPNKHQTASNRIELTSNSHRTQSQKWPKMAKNRFFPNDFLSNFWALLGHFRPYLCYFHPFWAILDYFGPRKRVFDQNDPKIEFTKWLFIQLLGTFGSF